METFNIQLTDTFGDEPNYSWVKETKVKAKSFRGAIIKAKKEFDITSKHKKETTRETVQLWFPSLKMVMYIEYAQ